jgi:hypothetical protein
MPRILDGVLASTRPMPTGSPRVKNRAQSQAPTGQPSPNNPLRGAQRRTRIDRQPQRRGTDHDPKGAFATNGTLLAECGLSFRAVPPLLLICST